MHPLLRNVLQFVVAGVILALAIAAHSPYAKSIATVWEKSGATRTGLSLGSVPLKNRETVSDRVHENLLIRRHVDGNAPCISLRVCHRCLQQPGVS
jgi:hypothetical protein